VPSSSAPALVPAIAAPKSFAAKVMCVDEDVAFRNADSFQLRKAAQYEPSRLRIARDVFLIRQLRGISQAALAEAGLSERGPLVLRGVESHR